MEVNKVIYGDATVVDLTGDTITSDKLIKGYTAHDASGAEITGTLASAPLIPLYYDFNCGYVASGTWIYENPTNTYIDIYGVKADHYYLLTLGSNVGSRFRAMFSTINVVDKTTNVKGTTIINVSNPTALQQLYYTAPSDGYIIIGKDNIGKTGVNTYLYDVTEGWV